MNRIKDVFTGKAFRPDPLNSQTPLAERFAGEVVVAFSFSLSRMKAVTITFDRKGKQAFSTPSFVTLSEGSEGGDVATTRWIKDYAARAKTQVALVIVSHGWFASAVDHAFRGADIERDRLLREEPREIIMEAAMEAMLYGVVPHPKFEKSVTFTFQKELIAKAIAPVVNAGLLIGRVQVGCFSILNYIASQHFASAFTNSDLLIVDTNGILLVVEGNEEWLDVAYRSDASAGFIDEAIPAILARRPLPGKKLTVATTHGPDFWANLTSINPGCEVVELFANRAQSHVLEFMAMCCDASSGTPTKGKATTVLTDINPELAEPRPQIPAKYRPVFLAGLAGAVVMLILAALSYRASIQDAAAMQINAGEVSAVKAEQATVVAQITKAILNRKNAERIERWVDSALNTQPFLLASLEAIPPEVSVQSFNLKLTKGQAQIESVEIVLLGDPRTISRHIDAMTSRLQGAGLQLVSPDPVAIPGGIRFRGKFIYPPADTIDWGKPL